MTSGRASERLPLRISRPIGPHRRWNVTIAQPVTRPPAAPAAPAAGRPPRSTTPRATSSSPRSARNWRSRSPPTGSPATRGSRAPHSPSYPRPAPSDQSGSAARGHRAECHKVFKEQTSTRVNIRPEREKTLALARRFKEAAPETPVVLTVHELKRLARNAAEPMALSAELQVGGHSARTPHRPAHRHLRPQRHGRHVLRRTRRCRADRARRHPRRPSKARSSPRPRATTAGARSSSTTTCSPLPSP